MLITFFYALFGGILFIIALLNSGFKIFGKETNKSSADFLIVTYLFGTLFLVAGVVLTIMENKEDIAKTTQVVSSQITKQKTPEEKSDKTQKAKESKKNKANETKEQAKDNKQKESTNAQKPQKPKFTGSKNNFVTNLGWAQIKSPEKFVSCMNVQNRMPVGITDQFDSSERIFVWAQIYAPRTEEKVRLVWYDAEGNAIASKTYTIRQNLGEGYRIYYWKYLTPGRYTVSLFNGIGEEIGRIAINVI
jgi:hypothetical protein